jgi:hypothetical protein
MVRWHLPAWGMIYRACCWDSRVMYRFRLSTFLIRNSWMVDANCESEMLTLDPAPDHRSMACER